MKLSDREKKLLILAFDRSSTSGEASNALKVLILGWIKRYSDGYALVRDLEGGERVIYREKENPYGNTILRFGKYAGEAIKDVDPSYLEWLLDHYDAMWPETRRAIEKFLGYE